MRKIFLLFFSLFLILSCDFDNSIGYDINCVVEIHKTDGTVYKEGHDCTVTGNILKAMFPPQKRGLELNSDNHTYTTITASGNKIEVGHVLVSGKEWEYTSGGLLQVKVVLD